MMNDKNALEGGRISVLGARVHNLKNIDTAQQAFRDYRDERQR